MTNFEDIPQEKFDAMQKIINRSVTPQIKNLKINYIDIQDFKNIETISTSLADWNIIGGYNGNGKSSFVEAILTAIQGQKFFGKGAISPASLVKNGQDKAIIKILMKGEEQEIIVERTFKKGTSKKPVGETSLEASLNGSKISQADLDNLLNSLTIDPLILGQQTITEQLREVKKTLGINTFDIDKEIKSQEETTKEARAYEKQVKAIYDNSIIGGVPEKIEEKSMSDLLEKRKLFELLNLKKQEYSNIKTRIEELEKQLEAEKQKLAIAKQEGIELNGKVKEAGLTDLEDLDNEISAIEENNENARKYQNYLSQREQVLVAGKDLEKEVKQLDDLRSKRNEMIANSNIPKYMTIDEDLGILVDGIEYKLLNTAKKIEVAIDLILISGSPLRMIRIENGGEIDTKTLEKIKDKIIKNNFSIFIERPIIDKYDTIIINDGEIIDDKETFINNQ